MMSLELFEETINILAVENPRYTLKTELINARSSGLKLHFISYSVPAVFKNEMQRNLQEIIYFLKVEKSLNRITDLYISLHCEKLEKTLESFVEIEVRGEKFYFQKDSLILLHSKNPEEFTIDSINETHFHAIVDFSQSRYYLLIEYIKELQQLKSPIVLETISKLILKLSVADIALIFRLLDDEKLIENKTKTDIYRFIENSFESLRKKNISHKSVKNLFEDPTDSTIKKIDILLVRFRQHLQGLK